MLQTGEVVYCGSVLYRHGIFIDALVHPVVAHDLSAIESAVFRREGYLDVHLHTAGIVSGVGAIMYSG